MRNTLSFWKLAVCMMLICAVASVILQSAFAGEPRNARGTRVVAPGALDGCGRDDPFATLSREKPPEPPEPEKAKKQQQAPGQREVPAPLSLGGIVWSRTLPQAIINDTLVGVGERVAGRKVVSIHRDKVVLEADGKREALKLDTPTFRLTIRRGRFKG